MVTMTQLAPRTGGFPMLTLDTIRTDLEERLHDVPTKHHLSVRWEPAPGIARVGVMIHEYTWDMRDLVIDRLLAFERTRLRVRHLLA
jgi:hypothetical protein